MAPDPLSPEKPAGIVDRVRDFFAEVPGSFRNHLNAQELSRVSLTAVTAGTGFFGLLQALMLNASTIFPTPSDGALAAAVLTLVLEVFRRLDHGTEPCKDPFLSRHRR